MKTTKTLLAALAIALVFGACSKEDTNKQNLMATADADPSSLVLGFKQKMEDHQNGIYLKSSEKIQIDSAIWYIDATLNYTYADAGHAFARLHRDTLYTEMSLVNDYEAAYEEVFDAYDTFLTGLSYHYYEEVEGDNKQFIMARVDNMGPLPGNKQKLRIITLTGTGTLLQADEFGNDEAYYWDRNATMTCVPIPEPGDGAPIIFETLLLNHFQPQDPPNCRYYYYGSSDIVVLDYVDYQLNPTLTNYLDYKIYAASPLVGNGITSDVTCLDYNDVNDIHEMQFYYDHLKDFVNSWLNSSQNTTNKKLADVYIESTIEQSAPFSIFHKPEMTYRKIGLECSSVLDIPADL